MATKVKAAKARTAGTGDGRDGSSGKTGSGAADGGEADGCERRRATTQTSDDCSVVVDDADCDDTQLPFVFVHGTYGSGDNIANVAMLFGSNGYCQDRFVAVEYNSLGDSPVSNGTLDAFIDKVLEDTGAKQVVLAGHSQGTGHCVDYLGDAAHAAKVAKYINYSGVGMVPNNVPTLSLSSMNDLGGSAHHAPNAEKQVTFTEKITSAWRPRRTRSSRPGSTCMTARCRSTPKSSAAPTRSRSKASPRRSPTTCRSSAAWSRSARSTPRRTRATRAIRS